MDKRRKIQSEETSTGVLGRLARDQRGVIAVMFALMLPVLLMAVVMGVEIGNWFYVRRELQTLADAAALAGARELDAGTSSVTAKSRAEAEVISRAAELGISVPAGYISSSVVNWSGGTSNGMTINIGTAGNPYPVNTTFSKMFMGATIDMEISAIAAYSGSGGSACVLALSNTASQALRMSGSLTVTATGCDLAANSTASDAVRISGTPNITADCIYSAGQSDVSGSYTLTTSCGGVQNNAGTFSDPYSAIEPTTPTSCNQNDYHYSGSGSVTLSPGTYCGGLKATGSGNITLNSGTYYVHDGDLELAGSMTVNGTSVSFVITGSSSANIGAVKITGSGTMTMTAPTSGTYEGMLVIQDRDASSGTANNVAGSTNLNLTGVIYTPSTPMEFKGSSSTGNSCIVVIADTVRLTGSTGMATTNCASSNVELPSSSTSLSLVQ